MSRSLWPAILLAILAAAPAGAQVMQAEAWVGDGGRIIRPGDAPAPGGAIRPATRADWLGECEHRLSAANRQVDSGDRYEDVCRAWLDYYDRTGATAKGYGFTYAIPVSLTTIEVPGNCPPPAAEVAPPRPAARHRAVRDKRTKRTKLLRY